jgi:hypothetical protein
VLVAHLEIGSTVDHMNKDIPADLRNLRAQLDAIDHEVQIVHRWAARGRRQLAAVRWILERRRVP